MQIVLCMDFQQSHLVKLNHCLVLRMIREKSVKNIGMISGERKDAQNQMKMDTAHLAQFILTESVLICNIQHLFP